MIRRRTALVLSGCALAADVGGWTPPDVLRRAMAADAFATRLPGLVLSQWFDPAWVQPPLYRLRMDTGCRERLRDRVRYCARGAVEPLLMGLGQVRRP